MITFNFSWAPIPLLHIFLGLNALTLYQPLRLIFQPHPFFSSLQFTLASSLINNLCQCLWRVCPRIPQLFIYSITRSAGFQPLSWPGRPVWLRLSVCPPHTAGFPPSTVSLKAFSVFLVPASLEHPLFADHPPASVVEPDLDTIPTSLTRSDAKTKTSPVPLSSPQVHIQAVLPSYPDPDNREWPHGWESRLCEPQQLGTAIPPMIVVPTGQRRY